MSGRRTIVAIIAAGAVLGGCATIEPWQRENLAKPQMRLDPNPVHSAARSHTQVSREAASGGDTAEGGGCGCN